MFLRTKAFMTKKYSCLKGCRNRRNLRETYSGDHAPPNIPLRRNKLCLGCCKRIKPQYSCQVIRAHRSEFGKMFDVRPIYISGRKARGSVGEGDNVYSRKRQE